MPPRLPHQELRPVIAVGDTTMPEPTRLAVLARRHRHNLQGFAVFPAGVGWTADLADLEPLPAVIAASAATGAAVWLPHPLADLGSRDRVDLIAELLRQRGAPPMLVGPCLRPWQPTGGPVKVQGLTPVWQQLHRLQVAVAVAADTAALADLLVAPAVHAHNTAHEGWRTTLTGLVQWITRATVGLRRVTRLPRSA